VLARLRAIGIGLLSPDLERVMLLMSSKESRQMRQQLYGVLERSWLDEILRERPPHIPPGLDSLLESRPQGPRRRILFVRMGQTLSAMISGIPAWRLQELGIPVVAQDSWEDRLARLKNAGVPLENALTLFAALGGDARVATLNEVPTTFFGLPADDLRDLARHAEWQVHALAAIYGAPGAGAPPDVAVRS
jgi:hypothetical protein